MLKTYRVGDRLNAILPRYGSNTEIVEGVITSITRKYGKHEKRYTVDFWNAFDGVVQFYESELLKRIVREELKNA